MAISPGVSKLTLFPPSLLLNEPYSQDISVLDNKLDDPLTVNKYANHAAYIYITF